MRAAAWVLGVGAGRVGAWARGGMGVVCLSLQEPAWLMMPRVRSGVGALGPFAALCLMGSSRVSS